MRKQGLDAYHFRGGTRALRKWAERSGVGAGPETSRN